MFNLVVLRGHFVASELIEIPGRNDSSLLTVGCGSWTNDFVEFIVKML